MTKMTIRGKGVAICQECKKETTMAHFPLCEDCYSHLFLDEPDFELEHDTAETKETNNRVNYINNIEIVSFAPPKPYHIDWSQVNTLDDLIAIIKQMNITVYDDLDAFDDIKHLLKEVK